MNGTSNYLDPASARYRIPDWSPRAARHNDHICERKVRLCALGTSLHQRASFLVRLRQVAALDAVGDELACGPPRSRLAPGHAQPRRDAHCQPGDPAAGRGGGVMTDGEPLVRCADASRSAPVLPPSWRCTARPAQWRGASTSPSRDHRAPESRPCFT